MIPQEHASYVPSGGKKKYHLDLYKISIKQWRFMLDPESDEKKSDEIMANAWGMTREFLSNLPIPDYRKIVNLTITASASPVDAEGPDGKN